MKRYNKPTLDIVKFDNLDVITMSGVGVMDDNSLTVYDQQATFKVEESLEPVETSTTHTDITETLAPVESEPLVVETTPEPTPAEEDTVVEETSGESGSDTVEEAPDNDQIAVESVSEEVE